MSVLLEDLSTYCELVIKEEFRKYGIDIVNFYIMSINVPEKDPSVVKLKEIKEKAMYINTVGKDVYSFDASMDVMKTAAGNEGNSGGLMGAGMGLGMGLGVGGNMGNQMSNISNQMNTNLQQSQQIIPPPPPVLQYFVLINNQQQGPHDLRHMLLLVNQGALKKETFVWKQGMPNWEIAENQKDLQSLFNQVPPPPPINQV